MPTHMAEIHILPPSLQPRLVPAAHVPPPVDPNALVARRTFASLQGEPLGTRHRQRLLSCEGLGFGVPHLLLRLWRPGVGQRRILSSFKIA